MWRGATKGGGTGLVEKAVHPRAARWRREGIAIPIPEKAETQKKNKRRSRNRKKRSDHELRRYPGGGAFNRNRVAGGPVSQVRGIIQEPGR